MRRTRLVSFAALMAALANALSAFSIPIVFGTFSSSIHFSQLAIFMSGILAGPAVGLLTGAVGGLYMGLVFPGIPFIVGGIAILGGAVGLFAKKIRPGFAGLFAWIVQAPYVVLTDYVWFTVTGMPSAVAWGVITTILIALTFEAVVSAALAEVLIPYIKKAGFNSVDHTQVG